MADAPVVSSPLQPAQEQPLPYATTLMFNQAALDEIRAAGAVTIPDFVLPGGAMTAAHLTRINPFDAGAKVVAGSDQGEVAIDLSDMVMLSGTIEGDPTARVFISFSAAGINGVIRSQEGTTVISSGPFGQGHAPVIYRMSDLPEGAIQWREFTCGLDRLHGGKVPAQAHGGSTRAGPCRVASLAIETDWEYTNNIFGGNTTASAAYAVTLIAADSEIYQADINTRLSIGFLRVWSDAADPYTTTDNYDRLFEFQDYWNANMGHVPRHTAHFLAGVLGSTGGVAYLPGLCNGEWAYGLSSYLAGFFPYPLQDNHPQNWDLMVTSHELGHNFGSPHTHDVGVDGCGNGNCNNANQGTIMSYCHTCSGGMANIVLTLHTTMVNNHILPYLANDAPCNLLDDGVVISQHPSDLTVGEGQDAVFTVTASTTSGSPAYQWKNGNTALSNGVHYSGVTTASLTIHDVVPGDAGLYKVTVSNCGSEDSNSAQLTVSCPADFDNSGFVDTDDYDAFVHAFEAGTDNADFDNSGFVDTDDFDAFVQAFEAGC